MLYCKFHSLANVYISYRHLLYDEGVTEVEIWLFLEELMEIALLSHFVVFPRGIPKYAYLTNPTTSNTS